MTVTIGNRRIGPDDDVYVIAEIGGNHDGELEKAYRYIETARWAGADAAKFQLYRADELYPGQHTEGALPDWWLPHLKQACEDNGLDFLCSVFSLETLDAYVQVDPVAVKIASPESHNLALLDAAAQTGLPVLVATGASTWRDVLGLMDVMVGYPWVLLHCTSAYPAPESEANLSVIEALVHSWHAIPVGLSDHTLPGPAPALAVALGACVIEKHLTFNRTLPGPDHGFATEPKEFAQMVSDVRKVRALLGDGVKRVTASEDPYDRRAAA